MGKSPLRTFTLYIPRWDPYRAYQNLTVLFKLTNLDLAREPQSNIPWTLVKACALVLAILSLHPVLASLCNPCTCAVYFHQDLWLINLTISITLVVFCWIVHSASNRKGFCLRNANVTVIRNIIRSHILVQRRFKYALDELVFA